MQNLLFTILSTIILLVGIKGLTLDTKPYDFRKTVVKIEGNGHGSGSIIDTNLAKSLILTNRHVCDGITLTSLESRKIRIAKAVVNFCDVIESVTKEKLELCTTKRNELNLLLETITSVGRKVSIMFNNHTINLVDGNINRVTGIVKYVSATADLCLIEVNRGQLPVIRISDKLPKAGDRVFALGNPLNSTNHMTDGYIGDRIRYANNNYIHHTAEIYAGSSGSPLVNEDGELIGVTTLGTRAPTISYAAILEDVVRFLTGKMLKRTINTKLEE